MTLVLVVCNPGHGRFHYLLFVTCGLCLMTVIMEMLDIGYLLPAAHCDLGLTTKDKGTLNAMVFAVLPFDVGERCKKQDW
uniref:Uncharacterized protein n=1 Tax=Timema genevievae TaxID=629358 RepID=A0A7R9K0I2_TIMGE|nr:unnamed protein product [Timema genevievae]